jgi:hypothetical protein
VLIKSVASTIPSYAMSSFLMPISFTSSLDRIFKKFWWGFPKDRSRNLSLKSWSSIYLPKHEGGLGFRRMHVFNLSLITKLGWKMISNTDCLWVRQLQKKYIKYGDFLSSPNLVLSFLALERNPKDQTNTLGRSMPKGLQVFIGSYLVLKLGSNYSILLNLGQNSLLTRISRHF